MNTTIEALILFIKSLPSDSLFEIISFGDYYKCLSDKIVEKPKQKGAQQSSIKDGLGQSEIGISYTDHNVEKAIERIKEFKADMCGTEIFEPLREAIEKLDPLKKFQKQIFLLTDGQVSTP